jgi:hypothetical protein
MMPFDSGTCYEVPCLNCGAIRESSSPIPVVECEECAGREEEEEER